MRTLIIAPFFLFIILNGSCQTNTVDITGTWQYGTSSLNSGYLDNYKFDSKNQSFTFNTNEFNGLNRIISIGGKYDIKGDTIIFYVNYTIEYIGGYPIRSKMTTLSDSWELIDGKIEKIDLSNKRIVEKELLSRKLEESTGEELILIGDRSYYKTK